MQTFYFTDPGKVRSHNEDSVTIISNDKKEFVLFEEVIQIACVLINRSQIAVDIFLFDGSFCAEFVMFCHGISAENQSG